MARIHAQPTMLSRRNPGPARLIRRLGILLACVLTALVIGADQWLSQQLLVTESWLTQPPSRRWLTVLLAMLGLGAIAVAYGAMRLSAARAFARRMARAWPAAWLGLALLSASAAGLGWMWSARPSADDWFTANLSTAPSLNPGEPVAMLPCHPSDLQDHTAIDYPLRSPHAAEQRLLVRKLCHGDYCDLRLASRMSEPTQSHCWASGPSFEQESALAAGETSDGDLLLVSDGLREVVFCSDAREPVALLRGDLGGRSAPPWFMLLLSGLALAMTGAELLNVMRCRRRDTLLRGAAPGWSDAGGWLHVPQLQRLLHLPELAYTGPVLLLQAQPSSSVYRGGQEQANVVCGNRELLLSTLHRRIGGHVLSALLWSLCGVLAAAPYWLRLLLASPC